MIRPIHGDPVQFGVEGGEDDRRCGFCEHWCPGAGGQGLCEIQFRAVEEELPTSQHMTAADAACCIEDEGSDEAERCPWYEERGF